MLDLLLNPHVAFAALVIAAIADVITTLDALEDGADELNPIIAWMMQSLGGKSWVAGKLAATMVAGGALMQTGPIWALWLLVVITLGVAWYNTRMDS